MFHRAAQETIPASGKQTFYTLQSITKRVWNGIHFSPHICVYIFINSDILFVFKLNCSPGNYTGTKLGYKCAITREMGGNVLVQCFEFINRAQWPKCGHNWKHTLFSLNPAQHVILWSAAVNRVSNMEEGGSPRAKNPVVGLHSYYAGKLCCQGLQYV